MTENPVTSPSHVSPIPANIRPNVTHGAGGSAAKKHTSQEDFTVLQLNVLKDKFENGNLHSPQGRYAVADWFTKDSGTLCDVKRIIMWCGNYH